MESFNLQSPSENHLPEHRQLQPVPPFRTRSTTATSRYLSYPPTTAVFHANSEPTLTAPMDHNSNVYGNSIQYQPQHVYPSQNPHLSATTVPYPRMSSGFVRPYAPYETSNRVRQFSQHVPTSYGQAASYNTNQHLNQYMETLSISSSQVAPMNSPNYEANMSQLNSPNYASTDTSCTSNYSESPTPTPPRMFTNRQETPVIHPVDSIQPDSTMMPSPLVTINDADRRKERNRKASQRSREKKKKLILNQALEIEELKRRNEELNKRIEQIYQYCRGHHFPLPNF